MAWVFGEEQQGAKRGWVFGEDNQDAVRLGDTRSLKQRGAERQRKEKLQKEQEEKKTEEERQEREASAASSKPTPLPVVQEEKEKNEPSRKLQQLMQDPNAGLSAFGAVNLDGQNNTTARAKEEYARVANVESLGSRISGNAAGGHESG